MARLKFDNIKPGMIFELDSYGRYYCACIISNNKKHFISVIFKEELVSGKEISEVVFVKIKKLKFDPDSIFNIDCLRAKENYSYIIPLIFQISKKH